MPKKHLRIKSIDEKIRLFAPANRNRLIEFSYGAHLFRCGMASCGRGVTLCARTPTVIHWGVLGLDSADPHLL